MYCKYCSSEDCIEFILFCDNYKHTYGDNDYTKLSSISIYLRRVNFIEKV